MTVDEHLNDRQAFELAMFRVRAKAVREGRHPTHREMLEEAQTELEAENQRLRATNFEDEKG